MKNFIAIAYLSVCEMIGFILGFAIVFASPYLSAPSIGAMMITTTGILMVTFGVLHSYKRRHSRHSLY